MSIHSLDDIRPHVLVKTRDENCHIIPRVVFEKVAAGRLKVTDISDFELIIPEIVKEWLSECCPKC